MAIAGSEDVPRAYVPTPYTLAFRVLAWCSVTGLFAFLVNVYLTQWNEWPGARPAFGDDPPGLAWVQVLIYVAAALGSTVFVLASKGRSLRSDGDAMTRVSNYVVKAAFWAVFLVGIADAVISFLRVEELLPVIVGNDLTQELGRNQFRAPYVHFPLIVASFVIAAFTRGLGFAWLALLVVVAELQIVISRFVYSYEQAFMGDLVRMWYASLFLFASAHTLVEEGHVRVDVLYSAFTTRTKGLVNAIGSVVLGLPFCWVVLILGMSDRTSIITSPLLALEVTQSGFGMYIKYLMAAFLAIFAGTMAIQFSAYMLQGIADLRDDPGRIEHDEPVTS